MKKLNIENMVIERLTACPEQKFTAREIAEWIFETYPEWCAEKKEKSKKITTDAELVTQIVAEIGSNRPSIQSDNPQIKTIEDKPRKYYFTLNADEAGSEILEHSGELDSNFAGNKAGEEELYELLAKYLQLEEGILSKRINEKKSSNNKGKNGNLWLHPDVVGVKILGSGWHETIKECVKYRNDRRAILYSYEVKIEIKSRSQARVCFFQALINSSPLQNPQTPHRQRNSAEFCTPESRRN